MTIATILALFGSMVVLALIPGPGVLTVVARSMASGFRHGAVTALGIVFGDYVFIILSILGLVALADTMGNFFVVLKYIGAAYLIWLAVSLWRSSAQSKDVQGIKDLSFISNFLAGLFTTLGNPKAILFYVGFFPTFLDLSTISVLDLAVIMTVATTSVGGVMLSYAYVASKTGQLLSSNRAPMNINRAASGVMGCSAVLLVAKA